MDKDSILSKHYKYIHLLVFPDSRKGFFNERLLEVFSNGKNGFDFSEHLFITPFKNVFDAFKSYGNIIYADNCVSKKGVTANIVNMFAPYGDWVFMHCALIPSEIIKIKPKFLHKIIWRTWGHDTRVRYWKGRPIHNTFKKLLLKPLWVHSVKQIKAIGIANTVDEINATDIFGKKIKTIHMPYPSIEGNISFVDFDHKNSKNLGKQKALKIMLGHSGYEAENHFRLLESLVQNEYFKKAEVYLPCAYYASQSYVNSLKKFIAPYPNVKMLEEFIPLSKYIDFVNQMDIVILDGKGSYALGNLEIAVSLEKTIFLNRNGIIRRAFDADHLPYYCTDQLSDVSYDVLVTPVIYPKPLVTSLASCSYACSIQEWHNILDFLNP